MTDLDDYLAGEFELPEEPEERERFKVTNDRMATWAQHLLGLRRAEVERITQLAADRIDQVNAWKEQALAGPLRDVAFFEGLLTEYVRPFLDQQLTPLLEQGLSLADAWDKVRNKGYPLPGGRIQGRKSGGGPTVADVDAYVAWCIANDRLDLIRAEPAKKILNDSTIVKDDGVYTEDGVKLDGVGVEPVEIRIKP